MGCGGIKDYSSERSERARKIYDVSPIPWLGSLLSPGEAHSLSKVPFRGASLTDAVAPPAKQLSGS
jgi:hypothetical protein